MKFHQIFRAAIYEPKKLAAFRLLPIGKVFRYVFIFVALLTVISFMRFLFDDTTLFDTSPELAEYGTIIGGLIYPIAFLLQTVISTFFIFIQICVFAYVGVLILRLNKRRGEYRHMWRTAAISMTVPIILTIILDFFQIMNSYSTFITFAVHITYITFAARNYPKKPL